LDANVEIYIEIRKRISCI